MAKARRPAPPHGDIELTEQALRQANQELRQLIDFLPQHVIVLDAKGTLVHANQTLLDFYGRTLEEMQSAGTAERVKRDVHPDDFERVRSERQIGFAKRSPFEIEKRLLGKDGRYSAYCNIFTRLVSDCLRSSARASIAAGRAFFLKDQDS
jgi:PAS domain S-box-containing protein